MILPVLIFMAGCGGVIAYQEKQNVYIKPGQVFTAENSKNYVLLPGKPLDWSKYTPEPEIIYVNGGEGTKQLTAGKRYAFIWNNETLNKEPIYVYPGQPFEFHDEYVYILVPGPVFDSSKDPNIKVTIAYPGVRKGFVEGGRYALIPPPEVASQYIQGQTAISGQGFAAQNASTGQPPNQQYIHIYNENDWIDNMYTLQQMQRQNMHDMQESTDRTLKVMDDSIKGMGQSQRDTLGILEEARRQDELYRQQQEENRRLAYGK